MPFCIRIQSLRSKGETGTLTSSAGLAISTASTTGVEAQSGHEHGNYSKSTPTCGGVSTSTVELGRRQLID